MKKLWILSLWLLSIVLIWCSSSNTAPNADVAADPDNVMLTADQETDTYKIYSQAAFDAAVADEKRVVLNFRASRCPTCTDVSNDILANLATLPADVIVLETDFDQYEELKAKHNVRQQTTFVFFDAAWEYVKTVESIRSFTDLVSNL